MEEQKRKESLAEWADNAKINGFIDIMQLSQILADESQYIDDLPRVWKKFQCDIRLSPVPDVKTWNSRADAWYHLLARMATGMVTAINNNWNIKKRLPAYLYDKALGILVTKDNPADGQYIKIEDLKIYFNEVVKLPLPTLLFPNIDQQKNNPKHLRPSQVAKQECRKVAQQLWDKDSSITIADMIFKDEITRVCGTITYTEKTIRNWIKDIAPSRKPGRRPQKKK